MRSWVIIRGVYIWVESTKITVIGISSTNSRRIQWNQFSNWKGHLQKYIDKTCLYSSMKYALMKKCCPNNNHTSTQIHAPEHTHTHTHIHTHTHTYIYIYIYISEWGSVLHHLFICSSLTVSKSKVGNRSRGWPEGPLFDRYYTKVHWKALLLFLGCSTYPWSLPYNAVKQGSLKYHFLSLWSDST